jgi:hypothetical protein
MGLLEPYGRYRRCDEQAGLSMPIDQIIGYIGLAFFSVMLVISLYLWSKRDSQ